MADEKSKIVTDATGPDAGPAPVQPEAGGGTPAPKQEQPAPEAVSLDKATAPEQATPAQPEKGADAPKEQKAASVSVFNFSEIMAEKKAAEKAAAKQEAKAPDKGTPPTPTKEDGPKQEKPKEQEQAPKRRGRPPKEDKAKSAAPAQKEAPGKKDKAAQKPAPAKKAEKAPKAPKPAKGAPEVKAPVQAETPAAPAEAPRPAKDEQIVYIKLSELHAFKNHPFQVRNDEEMKAMVSSVRDKGVTQPANPMAYIKTESDVLKFVNALIANTKGDGKEGDEFWTKAETLLYCALVAYIVFEGPEEERNMNTLVEMINSMEVREDDESFKNAVDYMFDGLAKRNPQHFAVRQYAKYKLASGKTAKSILISCGARLAPFDIAELREIMSYDELELDKLGDEKTALFFLISDTDTTYNFIVALAFSQMFNLLCERADNKYGGRLPHHVRVLWDEAANTGQVPGLEKIVAVIRSREISLTLFYQAMSQCKALYKDNAETIMGNMDSIVFLGGREASTLKDISENWLGKATISMQTDSRTRGQSESYGLNTQRLGRELLTTSEITTMPGNKCLLQLRGLPPFFSPKYDLKQHPNYRYTAEYDSKRNAFHLERLTSRRLRLKPEEEYTVYEVDASDEDADILNYDDLDSADDFV